MIRQGRTHTRYRLNIPVELLLLLGIAAVLVLYVITRYGGAWGETDTSVLVSAIRPVLREGSLLTGNHTYPNGYAFQSLAVFLIQISGVTLPSLQLYGSAVLMLWLVIPIWLLYRELTGSHRGALLASLLLLIQPEFLFPIIRGTHEKFTRGLMLLCLFLLVRSLRAGGDVRRFVPLVLAFYAATYAMITFNNLLASSFFVAVGLALLLTLLILRLRRVALETATPVARRLLYVVGVSLVLTFLFTFYIYPPARHNVLILNSITEKLAALLLDVDKVTDNPYTTVGRAWINLPTYVLLSLANWLTLAASATIWLWQSIQWWRRKQAPEEISALLLWAFYGGFVGINVLSMFADLSGAIGNLQHRVFPSFVMLAAPLVARWLIGWRPPQNVVGELVHPLLWGGIGVLAVLSVFKATNEPMFSNKWLFHIPAETQTIDWKAQRLPKRSLWTGFDERLNTAVNIRAGVQGRELRLDQFEPKPGTRDFLISDVTRLRSQRLEQPLPIGADSFVTYDNGQAQIYHLRPRTPFQR